MFNNPMRLLVVEDDQILGSSLKRSFEKHAYGVDWLTDGEAGLAALADSEFTAAVLDVNLPRLNGVEVLRAARAKGIKTPILLLTARDRPQQKVEGLDSGADDYLVKPFDLDELLARVRALIRRGEGRTETLLKCGAVELEPAAMSVRMAGAPVAITAKEFRVLKLLMERAGKYVTKGDIEYVIYNADNMTESNTTEVTIYALRKKLGSEFIQSMRGVGYRVAA